MGQASTNTRPMSHADETVGWSLKMGSMTKKLALYCALLIISFSQCACVTTTTPPAVCADERAMASAGSRRGGVFDETEFRIHNTTNSKALLYWVDFDGSRKFYSEILPHQTVSQRTYRGHVWVVTNEQGLCLSAFTADKSMTSISI
jgi:hypothetical protein